MFNSYSEGEAYTGYIKRFDKPLKILTGKTSLKKKK